MNTTVCKRIRDYKQPSDDFWKHATVETLYDVTLRHEDGCPMAAMTVRGAGHPYTGVEWIQPYDENANMVFMRGSIEDCRPMGADPNPRFMNYASWDCREWQMWRGRPYGLEQRPRWVPAICNVCLQDKYVRVWCEYEVDGVRTHQDWIISDQTDANCLQYDCLITIENISDHEILDYSQFFASYTQVNGRQGAFIWDNSGDLTLSWDIGIEHLDKFIVAKGSPIDRAGCLPHFPRTEGLVGAHWLCPVLVGHATQSGWRHVLLAEETYLAGLTVGMTGVAMDYVLYPGRLDFQPGEKFTNHIRHLLLHESDLPHPKRLQNLYDQFASEHIQYKSLAT